MKMPRTSYIHVFVSSRVSRQHSPSTVCRDQARLIALARCHSVASPGSMRRVYGSKHIEHIFYTYRMCITCTSAMIPFHESSQLELTAAICQSIDRSLPGHHVRLRVKWAECPPQPTHSPIRPHMLFSHASPSHVILVCTCTPLPAGGRRQQATAAVGRRQQATTACGPRTQQQSTAPCRPL